MNVKYDRIGIDYSSNRKSDPRIAHQIYSKLKGATRIVNIGAGSGSYEPEDISLVAVEPSARMISQRQPDAHPVVQSFAEELPFETNSFSHAMTVLSMHHWANRKEGFNEINRVAREGFLAVTWNPEAAPFWLTRDYFPEIFETDKKIFPYLSEFHQYFDDVEVSPLLIPEDCQDGFLAAYWKRPEAYLNEDIRKSISTFAKLDNLSIGLNKLEKDIKSGNWKKKNKDILNASMLDVGYIIITANTRKD